jgi:hypothetical protein
MVMLAYIIALLLKAFNTYDYFLQEARVESKHKDLKIQDVFKSKFFHFYSIILVQNEFLGNHLFFEMMTPGGFRYYKSNDANSKCCWNILPHVYSFVYALFVLAIYKIGELNDDHRFMNAATICGSDYLLELLGIIPAWST